VSLPKRSQMNRAVLSPAEVEKLAQAMNHAGASPKDVQAHLGHESVETTTRSYARVRPGRSEDLATRLNALIAEEA
jgi:integrase